MDGYTISQVAERTGFPATTLRYYEQSGLVRPARSPAGYRLYDDRHLELLAFIGRAKGFGLSLDEITELLGLLDQDRCAPVQDRLHELVTDRIADAQTRIAELVAFCAELQRAAVMLQGHTPDGPCDDGCGCTIDPRSGDTSGVVLAEPRAANAVPVACTLGADLVPGRIDDWQRVFDAANSREHLADGVRVRFDRSVDVTALAQLAVAEQGCCQFFRFAITIDNEGVAMDITGPPDARLLITALAGAAT